MVRIATLLAILTIAAAACRQPAEEPVQLPDDSRARTSYSVGLKIGSGLTAQPLDLDPDWVERGIRDALAGQSLLSARQADAELQAAQSLIHAGSENAAAGEAFLADNRGDSAVTVLDSGVQYRVVSAGAGAPPEPSDQAVVQYRVTTAGGGDLVDLFAIDQTETVRVGDLIPGLAEVLTLMPPRSRWVVAIPPERAYGERGRPPDVGPNVTLVFDVMLVAVDGRDPG